MSCMHIFDLFLYIVYRTKPSKSRPYSAIKTKRKNYSSFRISFKNRFSLFRRLIFSILCCAVLPHTMVRSNTSLGSLEYVIR